MSDISSFIRRGQSNTETINKLQALITPLAFPDPEADSLKERIILSSPVRKRTITSVTGLDITTVTTGTRDRLSNTYTVVPDTSTPSAYAVSNTTTGTITFGEDSIIKGGCGGLFNGNQYITIPDNAAIESESPIGLMLAFKTDGTQGSLALYCKKDESTATNAGIYVEILKNAVADFEQSGLNFDNTDFNISTQASAVRVHIADGSNEVDFTQTTTADLFDGSVHTITVNIANLSADFDATDFDATDFDLTTNQTIEVFVDKVSEGSTSTASITGTLLNSRDGIFGGRDNGGTIDSKLHGYVALFELQNHLFTQAEIDTFHDDDRVSVTNQLNAIHFCGDDSTSTLVDVF